MEPVTALFWTNIAAVIGWGVTCWVWIRNDKGTAQLRQARLAERDEERTERVADRQRERTERVEKRQEERSERTEDRKA